MSRCTAIAKGTRQQCKKSAINGTTKCKSHGGASRRGIAHPNYRHGRYAKAPERLLERWDEARSDRELLALREDIAMLDARLGELIGRVDSGESGAWITRLQEAQNRVDEAHRRKDNAAVAEGLNEIRGLIKRGGSDYAAWAEIDRLWERRRKLVESERKRLMEMQQVLQADQALAFVGATVEVLERRLRRRDETLYNTILNEIRGIWNAAGEGAR